MKSGDCRDFKEPLGWVPASKPRLEPDDYFYGAVGQGNDLLISGLSIARTGLKGKNGRVLDEVGLFLVSLTVYWMVILNELPMLFKYWSLAL